MKAKHLLLGLLVTCIWGLNFSVIKLGLESINPFVLAACRFFLAAIPWVFVVRKPNVSLRVVGAYGLLFGVGLWGIVTLAIQVGVSAGVASLVLQFSPFFTVLLSAYWFQERLYLAQIIGIGLAAAGLIYITTLTDGSVSIASIGLVLVGALSWSVSNVLVKQYRPKPMFSFLIWSSLFSPIPLVLLAYLSDGYAPFEGLVGRFDALAIFSILFQVYVTTIFGYWAWNSLIDKYPLSKVAPLSLLVPIFGLIGSYAIFGEHIGLGKIVSAGLVLLGLAFLISTATAQRISHIFRLRNAFRRTVADSPHGTKHPK